MATLAVEVTRQQRYGGCFCLAFIDLDGFKQLNDSQGHEAGDTALLQVSFPRNFVCQG
jgi:diguanylate cyclase (GGDEF)-like protein